MSGNSNVAGVCVGAALGCVGSYRNVKIQKDSVELRKWLPRHRTGLYGDAGISD